MLFKRQVLLMTEALDHVLYLFNFFSNQSSWKQGSTQITFGNRTFKDRILIDSSRSTEYNLKMTKMLKNDEGNYLCTAGEKTFRRYILKAKGRCYCDYFLDLLKCIPTQVQCLRSLYFILENIFVSPRVSLLKNTRLLYL